MYGLGRKPSPPDSRDYKLAAYHLFAWPDFANDCAYYSTGPCLDQGETPHCVGFSCASWSNAEPVINDYTEADGHEIYYECKVIDGEPLDESGSYVRSGAKALKARGRIGSYAFGELLDARRFLLQQGPVVFGIDWTHDMFYPDAFGVIHYGEGYVCGGHAIVAVGADPLYCTLQNTWGRGWGQGGLCRISWGDLEKAFGRYGEAMAAVELPLDDDVIPEPPEEPTHGWFATLTGFVRRAVGWLFGFFR